MSNPNLESPINVEIPIFEVNGVRVMHDEHYLVGILDRKYGPETEKEVQVDGQIVAGEIQFCANSINLNPDYWSVFGFSVEQSEQQTIVTTPSTSSINDLRLSLQERTGIHKGVFVDTPTYFTPMEFAQHLSVGEVPIATEDPEYLAHDNFEHKGGYMVMCEPLFKRLQSFAQKAIEKDSVELAGIVAELSDTLTGEMPRYLHLKGHNGLQMLASYYGSFLPPLVAGFAAWKDARAQRATTERIKTLATEKAPSAPPAPQEIPG